MSMLPLVAMLALAAHPAHPASSAKPATAAARSPCFIVYGKNWGFMATPPKGWSSVCGAQSMKGTVLTLWPSNESIDAVTDAIYVTVSGINHQGMDAFVKYDIEHSRALYDRQKPPKAGQPPMHVGKVKVLSPTRRLVHYQHDVGDRNELVEYVKGPTAYYIVVLTTDSAAMTRRYRPAFEAYMHSFSPLTITFENSAKRPAAKP